MPRGYLPRLALPLVLWLASSCGAGGSGSASSGTAPPPSDPDAGIASTMTLSSPAFAAGGAIPATYTCDGAGISPPLSWSGTPEGAVELAVTVIDPDAPGGAFIHWVLLGLSPAASGIPEEGPPPDGVHGATASSGRTGYAALCPPRGQRHRYRFSVFALRGPDSLPEGVSGAKALTIVRSAALARGTMIATYGR